MADRVFEFAPLVLRADRAAVGDSYVSLANVLWSAQLDSMAGETAVRVLGHEQLDNALANAN